MVNFRYVLFMLLDLVIMECAMDDMTDDFFVLSELDTFYYLDHCAAICVLQFRCLFEHSAAWFDVYNIFGCHMV